MGEPKTDGIYPLTGAFTPEEWREIVIDMTERYAENQTRISALETELKAAREENERAQQRIAMLESGLRVATADNERIMSTYAHPTLFADLQEDFAAERTRREAAEAKAALADWLVAEEEWQDDPAIIATAFREFMRRYDAIANQGKEDA